LEEFENQINWRDTSEFEEDSGAKNKEQIHKTNRLNAQILLARGV
jgi:hypothetical protein